MYNTDTTVEAPGDHSGFQATVGKRYTSRYRLSEWFLRGQDDVLLEGRLTIKRLIVTYKDTGFFQVEVTPQGRSTTTHVFTGRRIGVTLIGSPGIETTEEKFLITAAARGTIIDLVSDSYLPTNYQSYAFSGRYSPRSQAV